METPATQPHLAPRHDTASRTSASAPGGMSPEAYHDASRRLAWLAFVYSATYLVVHGAGWILGLTQGEIVDPEMLSIRHILTMEIKAFVPIALGVYVFLRARRGDLRHRSFVTAAVAFEVVAALGIVYGDWGWTGHVERIVGGIGATVGFVGADLQTGFLDKLHDAGQRLVYFQGIPWVGIWILMVPMMLPLSAKATLLGSLLSAATVPAVYGGSLLFYAPPEPLGSWARAYVIEMTIPAFICAGVAILGSRIVYRLTRDLALARRMGSYRLTEKIGAGGMGEVWKAEHRMLARPAAIKLIHPESLGDPNTAATAIGRFEREAQVIATLTSPHTVVLYDFGVTDEGDFYYVMELLDGLDLRTLVERHGPLPADRVRRILVQACHSLHDAHASGLIHRDVKPANIFICRRGVDFDFVKVLDFGLVKETGTAPGQAQLTLDGITTGTPAFMPPEMALGKAIDARTDLYALGCVGFWLLTGRLVFEGETPLSIVTQHVSETPPRPSACTELDVPAELENLILRCLEKKPEDRPRSATELATQLAAIVPEETWTDEQAQRWWGTHRPRPASQNTSKGVPAAPSSMEPGTAGQEPA